MINKKRAMAHIEMAISFGMFALFTFWLIVYLNPIRNQNISNVLIDTIENEIITNTSIELLEVPVNTVVLGPCIKIKNPFNTTTEESVFVKDAYDNLIRFKFPDTQNISIATSGNFYKIYYANTQFNSLALGSEPCVSLNSSQFNYTSTRLSSPLLISRLEVIKWSYDNNYDWLKEQFNLPRISDFSINITNLATRQNLFEMKKKKPRRVEVIAKEIPVEIIQRDGSMLKAIMNIQVW